MAVLAHIILSIPKKKNQTLLRYKTAHTIFLHSFRFQTIFHVTLLLGQSAKGTDSGSKVQFFFLARDTQGIRWERPRPIFYARAAPGVWFQWVAFRQRAPC